MKLADILIGHINPPVIELALKRSKANERIDQSRKDYSRRIEHLKEKMGRRKDEKKLLSALKETNK